MPMRLQDMPARTAGTPSALAEPDDVTWALGTRTVRAPHPFLHLGGHRRLLPWRRPGGSNKTPTRAHGTELVPPPVSHHASPTGGGYAFRQLQPRGQKRSRRRRRNATRRPFSKACAHAAREPSGTAATCSASTKLTPTLECACHHHPGQRPPKPRRMHRVGPERAGCGDLPHRQRVTTDLQRQTRRTAGLPPAPGPASSPGLAWRPPGAT